VIGYAIHTPLMPRAWLNTQADGTSIASTQKIEMPVGMYTLAYATPACGLADRERMIWWDDDPPFHVGDDDAVPSRCDVAVIGGGFAGLSTALELAAIAGAAAGYPDIARYTTAPAGAITIAGQRVTYRNTNQLVGQKGWDIALSKTGFTAAAGR